VETKIKTLVKDIGDLADAAEQARLEQQRAHQAWLADMRKAEDERKREEAARRARQEAAQASARGKALEDHRGDVIARALGAWDSARAIREFCAAMEAAIEHAGPEQRTALRQWVGYAMSLADRIDPVMTPGSSPRRLAHTGAAVRSPCAARRVRKIVVRGGVLMSQNLTSWLSSESAAC
jgi:hypothetical protein